MAQAASDPYGPYIEAWRRRYAEAAEERRRAVRAARAAAARCADILVERYGARRVRLYGSLVREERFDPGRSDIDLAVEGLGGNLFRAVVDLLDAARPWAVDLKELEAASPELAEVVDAEGEVLRDARA